MGEQTMETQKKVSLTKRHLKHMHRLAVVMKDCRHLDSSQV